MTVADAVNLLVEQIEVADVVILNKVADAGPERVDALLVAEHLAIRPGALPDLADPFTVWRRAEAAA